jgi:biopolymer transport protein ExbD
MPVLRIDDEGDLPALNMTPMIDVILVLAIFFMCATKFTSEERSFDVDLPEAATAAASPAPASRFVDVRNDGGLRLDGESVSVPELVQTLTVAAAESVSVTIRGERDVAHGRMTEIYDACRAAGVRQLSIAVRSRPVGNVR